VWHTGAACRAERHPQAALAVPTDPHVPPTAASKRPTAAVRTGSAHRAAVGGAWTANHTQVAAGATGCWEEGPAFAAERSAHEDTPPLAGGGGLCSCELLDMGADGPSTAWSLTKTWYLRREAATHWTFAAKKGVHWPYDIKFKTLFAASWIFSGISPSIEEMALECARKAVVGPMS